MIFASISVLGCGWLGFPLAKRLVELGYLVKGSTTSPHKIPQLQQSKIIPYCININSQIEGENVDQFFQSDVLFLNIPFRRDFSDPMVYKQQIELVYTCLKHSPVKFVVLASSTSIYPQNISEVSEEIVFCPDNPRAQVLYEVEQLFLSSKSFATTVLRFGGLYGSDRKIGNSILNGKEINEGDSPVNLVHLEDAVAVSVEVIDKYIKGEIFNVVSDFHPTRKELYTGVARSLGVEVPKFSSPERKKGKVVYNDKLKDALQYRFKYPNPLNSF